MKITKEVNMKKLILTLFILINSFVFARTKVEWNVEEGLNFGEFVVTCDLYGSINHTFEVEIQPFEDMFSDGEDYDYSSEIEMKVEKEFNSNEEVAYYKCTLERNYEELNTFYFQIKNVMIIETM